MGVWLYFGIGGLGGDSPDPPQRPGQGVDGVVRRVHGDADDAYVPGGIRNSHPADNGAFVPVQHLVDPGISRIQKEERFRLYIPCRHFPNRTFLFYSFHAVSVFYSHRRAGGKLFHEPFP